MHYVPSLDQHLRSTTALTPTYHKSGGLKMAIGIAAAVAIPIAAPAIAGAIGTSLGVAAIGTAAGGTVLGSALVGGALGGLSSFALGGNPLLGAAGGALGGGLGAYGQGAGFTTSPSQVAAPQVGPPMAEVAASGAPTGAGATVGSVSVDPGAAAPGVSDAGFAGTSVPGVDTPISLGDQLGSVTGSETLSATINPTVDPTQGYYGGPTPSSPTATSGIDPTQGYYAAGAPSTPTAPSFIDRLGAGLSQAATKIGNKITNPEFLSEQGLKVGSNLLTNAIAGGTPDMTDRERMLMEQQDAALARLNAQEQQRFEAQRKGAESLQRQAAYFDPNMMGAQASYDTINRLRRAEQDRLRQIPYNQAGLRTQEQRRSNLDAARLAGTSFSQGFGRGVQAQTNLRIAGLNALPSPGKAYSTALTGQQEGAAGYYERLQKERDRTAGYLIDPLAEVFDTKRKQTEEPVRG